MVPVLPLQQESSTESSASEHDPLSTSTRRFTTRVDGMTIQSKRWGCPSPQPSSTIYRILSRHHRSNASCLPGERMKTDNWVRSSDCPSSHMSTRPWIPGCDAEDCVWTPRVIESLLGCRLRGRRLGCNPLVAGSRNTMAVSQVRQPLVCIRRRYVTVVSVGRCGMVVGVE